MKHIWMGLSAGFALAFLYKTVVTSSGIDEHSLILAFISLLLAKHYE